MLLEIGSKAPELNIPNTKNEIVTLKEYAGRFVVVYFYPKDNTPGCTTEGIEFTDKLVKFHKLNTEVIGISADSVDSHCKFASKYSLEVTLLSDVEHTVLERYGVWQKKKNFGKEYFGVVRSTFLIDPQGNINHIWRDVNVKDHVDNVLNFLEELKTVKRR